MIVTALRRREVARFVLTNLSSKAFLPLAFKGLHELQLFVGEDSIWIVSIVLGMNNICLRLQFVLSHSQILLPLIVDRIKG